MPDIELDIGAQLIASLEKTAAALAREQAREQRMLQAVRQIPLTAPPATTVAGVLGIDYPDTLKCKTGWYWDVKRLTLSGWTAGSVTVYLNGALSAPGELVAPFPSPAVFTFGKGQLLMHPDDRLIVVGTSITGTVTISGAATAVEAWYLPLYLA